MPLLVRTFPLTSSVDEIKQFAKELAERQTETDAFYRKFGVTHESWHVQQTGDNWWIIGVTQLANPADAGPRYAASTEKFDTWFKSRVHGISGIDLNEQPLGLPTDRVFAWSDGAENDLCA